MFEAPNESDPSHELLFCELGLCSIDWKMPVGSDSFCVGQCLGGMQQNKDDDTKSTWKS